ncbi:MAG: hypothetical protein JJU16_05275 [Alkalibacterium sp.]|nr:hypothetical protein [Alkalibacterium sp.]
MSKVDVEVVLDIFDKKAAEFKRFGSSHRRIQAIRKELEKELKPDEQEEVRFTDIQERVRNTDAMNVQEFHKSADRIAAMIKDADEREMWG